MGDLESIVRPLIMQRFWVEESFILFSPVLPSTVCRQYLIIIFLEKGVLYPKIKNTVGLIVNT